MNFAVIVAEDEQVVRTVVIRQNYSVVVVKAASCSPTKMHYGARFVFFHLILISSMNQNAPRFLQFIVYYSTKFG
jgi:hypothetical protein